MGQVVGTCFHDLLEDPEDYYTFDELAAMDTDPYAHEREWKQKVDKNITRQI